MASDIPDSIVEAFRVRPLMPLPELARLLGMDPATLREHVIAGDLPWRQKGLGKTKPHRVFVLADVVAFLGNMKRQSDREHGRLCNAEILRFSARALNDVERRTAGTIASSSPVSPITAPATRQIGRKPKDILPSSKRRRKSIRARIEI
jgi:hypothetical protein